MSHIIRDAIGECKEWLKDVEDVETRRRGGFGNERSDSRVMNSLVASSFAEISTLSSNVQPVLPPT